MARHFSNLGKKNIKSKIQLLAFILLFISQFGCLGRGDYALLPSIKDFSVVNETEAWLVKQNGEILFFNDNDISLRTDFSKKIVQIYFLNANEGWALEENGQLWATTNNGKDWQKKALLTEESPAFWSNQLIFADKDVGWLIGAFTVWMTQDGGNSWTMTYPKGQLGYDTIQGQPMNISVVNSDIVWLGFNNGGLLKTIDRGKTWEQTNSPAKIDIDAIFAFSAEECFVSGRGEKRGLFHTTDGGKTWKNVLPPEISRNLGINSISFIDKKNGWAVGLNFVTNLDNPETDIDVLLKTIDGGKSWRKVETNIKENSSLTRVKFTDQNNGWITGETTIYHSRDGGISWIRIFEVEDYNKGKK